MSGIPAASSLSSRLFLFRVLSSSASGFDFSSRATGFFLVDLGRPPVVKDKHVVAPRNV